MKRSYELQNLKELGLPTYAETYVRNHIGDHPQKFIFHGRLLAFYHEDYSTIEPKSDRLLVEALDREGFIRHDLGLNRYKMICLLQAVVGSESVPFIFDHNCVRGNSIYEQYVEASDERFEQFKSYIKSVLTELEYKNLALRYGLDGVPHTLEQCAVILGGVTRERTRQLEAKAIRKLRHHNGVSYILKLFLASDDEIKQEVADMRRKLRYIEEYGLSTD